MITKSVIRYNVFPLHPEQSNILIYREREGERERANIHLYIAHI